MGKILPIHFVVDLDQQQFQSRTSVTKEEPEFPGT